MRQTICSRRLRPYGASGRVFASPHGIVRRCPDSLTHRLLGHADPLGDSAEAVALSTEVVDERSLRGREAPWASEGNTSRVESVTNRCLADPVGNGKVRY